MLREVITEEVTFHGYFITENVQAPTRQQRRKNTSVAKIRADGRDGGESHRSIGLKKLQDELRVVDKISMADGHTLRNSRRA